MNRLIKFSVVVVLIHPWFSRVEGQEDRLGLADLAGYRAALSGKATADDAGAADPPAQVRFRDLWERPDAFRGRHVIVEGRVVRIFRQEAVGSFPALAEVWITRDVRRPILRGLSPSWADPGPRAGSRSPVHRHVFEDGSLRGQ